MNSLSFRWIAIPSIVVLLTFSSTSSASDVPSAATTVLINWYFNFVDFEDYVTIRHTSENVFVDQLIIELDSDKFATREEAESRLHLEFRSWAEGECDEMKIAIFEEVILRLQPYIGTISLEVDERIKGLIWLLEDEIDYIKFFWEFPFLESPILGKNPLDDPLWQE